MDHPMTDRPDLHRALGLTDDEFDMIVDVLGRAPERPRAGHVFGHVERALLVQVVTGPPRPPAVGGDHVLVGPGENAGVIDVGDGIAVAVRIESHNHPSAIEPYQGAATGVGGILRDIFTMGARPIALMDPLFMGPLERRAQPLRSSTGSCAASPATATRSGCRPSAGRSPSTERYRGNPLVNVFCLGVLPVERLVLGRGLRRRQPRRAARLADRAGTASAG